MLFQLAPNGQHEPLQISWRAIDGFSWPARSVGPVHAVETFSIGMAKPVEDRGVRDAETLGRLPHGGAPPDGLDHVSATFLGNGFLAMATSGARGF